MSRAGTLAVGLVLALSAFAAGCGYDDGDPNGGSEPLIVAGAASLQTAFTAYADDAGIDPKQSFAGSDQLAAQIRQGLRPDVFAAANTSLPDQLFAEGLVEEPTVFATNSLVIAVPASSQIQSIDDLTEPGLDIATGDPSVPVGSYTLGVLDGLPATDREAVLGNVATEEPDVAGIVAKLTQGAVEAGFVYVTDVAATDGRLRAIDLPAELQPEVAYAAAVVVDAPNPAGAADFIAGLLDGAGRDALDEVGFGPPPTDAAE